MNLAEARHNMIEQQIRPWDVLDQRVLELVANLPREDFVPSAYLSLAYADINIPLEHGQSMMAPKVEARMIQALNLQPRGSGRGGGAGGGGGAARRAGAAGRGGGGGGGAGGAGRARRGRAGRGGAN